MRSSQGLTPIFWRRARPSHSRCRSSPARSSAPSSWARRYWSGAPISATAPSPSNSWWTASRYAWRAKTADARFWTRRRGHLENAGTATAGTPRGKTGPFVEPEVVAQAACPAPCTALVRGLACVRLRPRAGRSRHAGRDARRLHTARLRAARLRVAILWPACERVPHVWLRERRGVRPATLLLSWMMTGRHLAKS